MHTVSSRKINTLVKNNLKVVHNTKKYYLNFQAAEKLINLVSQHTSSSKLILTSKTPLRNYKIKLSQTVKTIVKDDFTCVICKKKAIKAILIPNTKCKSITINFYTKGNVLLTKDHIVPKANDGKNTQLNYQCMCELCNTEKGSLDNFQFLIKKGVLNWDETFKLNWFERFVFSFIGKRIKNA